jgi:D-sedoheptulose 7-phosphate isomerase
VDENNELGAQVFNPNQIKDAASYFDGLRETLAQLSELTIDRIARTVSKAYDDKKTIFLFGNGGSASLASHFACDLSKGTSAYCIGRKRLRAVALTDNVPTTTAWANDSSYDDIFAEQLRSFVEPGDIAFAISCSGNSRNVLKALAVARESGATTIGLGGFAGGKMKSLCDISLIVPSTNMQFIEDLHLSVAHCIFTLVCDRIAVGSGKIAVATAY